MPETFLGQTQTLRQEQTLTPLQMQSLEFLMAPVMELQEKISAELDRNPMLELDSDGRSTLEGEMLSRATSADVAQAREESRTDADDYSCDAASNEDGYSWERDFTIDNQGADGQAELQRSHDFFLNSLVEQPSLQDQLLEQLRLSDVDPALAKAAELVIGSINDSGYLETPAADIAMAAGCDMNTVEKAIQLVQTFDPPGIGARSVSECLHIQLQRRGEKNKLMYRLVDEYLEEIARNHLPHIAKELQIDMDYLQELIADLRTLKPHPGAAIAPDMPVYVIPEIEVAIENDELVIRGHDGWMPKLNISKHYEAMLEDPTTPPDAQKYLREKLLSAQTLMRSLEQRKSTIRRITEALTVVQRDFFFKGKEALKPLTMQQIADRLNLHETTISRAIANKYMQTPFGIVEFRDFFTGGYQNASGEDVSTGAIKEKIRKIIEAEPPTKPLSDDKISQMLAKEGFTVARRTVAKYRESLGIPGTSIRKVHQ